MDAEQHEKEYRAEVMSKLEGLCEDDPTLIIRIAWLLTREFENKKLHDPKAAEKMDNMMIPPIPAPHLTMLEEFFGSYNGWLKAWESL